MVTYHMDISKKQVSVEWAEVVIMDLLNLDSSPFLCAAVSDPNPGS